MNRKEALKLEVGNAVEITHSGRNKGKRGIVTKIAFDDFGKPYLFVKPLNDDFEFDSYIPMWRKHGDSMQMNYIGLKLVRPEDLKGYKNLEIIISGSSDVVELAIAAIYEVCKLVAPDIEPTIKRGPMHG